MDETFIQRCIAIARDAVSKGELPFASIIVRNDEVVVEAGNEVGKGKDVTAHAEIIAMKKLQQLLPRDQYAECVLYTTVEPCPMCSFMIRELGFRKVVFSMRSPLMGGFSKWPILQDSGLEQLTGYFGKPPEVIGGVLETDMETLWDAFPVSPKGVKNMPEPME